MNVYGSGQNFAPECSGSLGAELINIKLINKMAKLLPKINEGKPFFRCLCNSNSMKILNS